jgi:hypothetical protein
MTRKRLAFGFLRRAFAALVYHPQVQRRAVRSLLLGYATTSAGLGLLVDSTYWRVGAFVTGGIAGTIAGLIGVGEMNTDADHSVALRLTKEAAVDPPKPP